MLKIQAPRGPRRHCRVPTPSPPERLIPIEEQQKRKELIITMDHHVSDGWCCCCYFSHLYNGGFVVSDHHLASTEAYLSSTSISTTADRPPKGLKMKKKKKKKKKKKQTRRMLLPLEEEVATTSPEVVVAAAPGEKAETACFDELLPVDVLVDILARLPARSLLRCTCVCKSWRAIIRSRGFVDSHLQKRSEMPNLNIITLSWMPDLGEFSLHYFAEDCHKLDMMRSWGQSATAKEEEEEEQHSSDHYNISNSCNGLICVFGRRTTYVVNPSIRRQIELPSVPCDSSANVALGYDASTGAYKVVRMSSSNRGGGHRDTSRCMVFTLGTSRSWRSPLGGGDLPFKVDRLRSPVVVANRFIVWNIRFPLWGSRPGPEVGVSFDIEKETFDAVVHPEGSSRCEVSLVTEVGGYLCIVDTPEPQPESNWHRNELWILTDYAERRWMKVRDEINLKKAENMSCAMSVGLTLLGIRDGKILMANGQGRFDFYDPETGCFDEPPMFLTYGEARPYVESLVSPEMTTIHQEKVVAERGVGLPPPPHHHHHQGGTAAAAAAAIYMKKLGKPWWQQEQEQKQQGKSSAKEEEDGDGEGGSWRQWVCSSSIHYDIGTVDEAVWPVSIPKGLIVYS